MQNEKMEINKLSKKEIENELFKNVYKMEKLKRRKIADKKYREKHREYYSLKSKEWGKNNKEKKCLTQKKYANKNPEKIKCHNLITNKKLKKDKCKVCSSKINLNAHHKDYSKPYDIIILCRGCHNDIHKNRIITSGVV